MAFNPETKEVITPASPKPTYESPTYYGAGNNIPLGHIALKSDDIDRTHRRPESYAPTELVDFDQTSKEQNLDS